MTAQLRPALVQAGFQSFQFLLPPGVKSTDELVDFRRGLPVSGRFKLRPALPNLFQEPGLFTGGLFYQGFGLPLRLLNRFDRLL